MPITRRISQTEYDKAIADAKKQGFAEARRRLDDADTPQPLTHEQLLAITDPAEVNARWGEISAALESGAARPVEEAE